ncbi:MAG: c-type cytochrome [Sandaracinaceae bacterium]|nr:c-type cytochrome [Sandaracinaceae bacterium]
MRTWAASWALLLALLGAGCDDDVDSTDRRPTDPARVERAGEGLYRRYCALCHGRDGEGYGADNAPMLAGQEWLRSASDEFITAAIANGRPGTPMSAWSRAHGGPLNDTQIEAIRVYLRSWQRTPRANVEETVVEGDARRGRLIYVLQCAECHGARGEGVDAVALANPAFLATASDGFLQYAVSHGRTGTRMVAFRDRLEPEQIDDVVAFIRALGDPAAVAGALRPPPEPVPDLPALADMQLVINPQGRPAHFTLREDRFVPAADVQRELERGRRIVILDARATSDWLRQRIPGALPVPFYELDAIAAELPRDGTPMVAYCACPHAASGHVVDALRRQGFTNTAVLDEGIDFWAQQGYPIATGPLDAPAPAE